MPLVIEALGFFGTLFAFIMWIPQGINVIRARKHDPQTLKAVSMITPILILLNAVLWIIYGFQSWSFWAGAPGIFNIPTSIVVITILARARRSAPVVTEKPLIAAVMCLTALIGTVIASMAFPEIDEHITGAVASIVSTALLVPQCLRIISQRKKALILSKVSIASQIMVVLNGLCWIGYGLLGGAFWISVPCYLNIPLALISIHLLMKARRKEDHDHPTQPRSRTR